MIPFGDFLAMVMAFDCGQDEYHVVLERRWRFFVRWRLDLFEWQDGVLLAQTTLCDGWKLSSGAAIAEGRAFLLIHHAAHCPRRQPQGADRAW